MVLGNSLFLLNFSLHIFKTSKNFYVPWNLRYLKTGYLSESFLLMPARSESMVLVMYLLKPNKCEIFSKLPLFFSIYPMLQNEVISHLIEPSPCDWFLEHLCLEKETQEINRFSALSPIINFFTNAESQIKPY